MLGIVVLVWAISKTVYMYDTHKLHVAENQWQGFDLPEKGDYRFTVVTSLFDIGRGLWWTSTRTYNEYLRYILQINNDSYAQGKCEATKPLYNLITNSKVSLVYSAIKMNPFKSDYFIWLDGGFGHGDSHLFLPDGIWSPKHLLEIPDKVTFIALQFLSNKTKDLNRLHKIDTAWIAGGMFAGGIKAMKTFYNLHKDAINSCLSHNIIDDDQTTFAYAYFQKPDNFLPVLGSWYDLLKPWK